MRDEMEEELIKAYNEEVEKNKKLKEDFKKREYETNIKKLNEENDELRRKISELENCNNAPVRMRPIETSIIINIDLFQIGFWTLLTYALLTIFLA